jgi:hypothetical protein
VINFDPMKFRLVLLILLISTGYEISAQYYDTGQDPAFLKWMQIKTRRFTLIYPKSYGADGLKFARSLDESFGKLSSLYPERKVRLPVVIHNYTTFSNGYVAWAPRRMEIYPTPEQNGIPSDPVDQLTIHELTHVLQMTSLNKGFTKVMSVFTGEQFTGAVSALLPTWFLEGDAVFAETLLSPSGRGKTPSFLKQMKAIALEKPKMYSYDKIISGSFRSYTPDQYYYGYQMIAWSYAKYGTQLWNNTLDFTGKYPFTLNPVNFSLRHQSSLTKSSLYKETFNSLKTLWQQEEKNIKPASYPALNRAKKREYINYISPVFCGKDSVAAIKTSLGIPAEFVLLNLTDRSEKRLHTPGFMETYFLSGSWGKIVWVEERPDPRWDNRTFSIINIMDIRQHVTRQLSFRSRYLAASLSGDGKYIAASENSVSNENYLIIMNASDGSIINKIPSPGNAYLERPQWSESDEQITVISLSAKGEGVLSFSVKNMEWKTMLDPGRDDLQSAQLRNDSLFFVSSNSGTDNIYILTPDKRTLKLTNSRFGAYDASVQGDKVVFTDYSAEGNNICRVNIRDAVDYAGNNLKDPSFLMNRFDTITLKSPDQAEYTYKPKPYRKIGHLIGVHSWMPFYADIEQIRTDPASVRPGLTILSQNQLSTVTSSIGYEYASDKTNQIHAKVTWSGIPPVIESQLDYGRNAGISKLNSSVADPVTIQPGLSFINTISLPLNFSTGRFSQYLRLSISDDYQNNYIYIREKGTYDYGQSIATGRFIFYNYDIAAIRDIFPRWGQVLDLSYTFAPADNNIYGSQNTLRSAFYFPGFLRNHSIRLRYETETQNPQKLIYYNNASLPRGYDNIVSEKINFLSADYGMPLIYPDLNLPGILFLKRIRSSFFYDYATGVNNHYLLLKQTHNYSETFSSFGVELLADYYILRIPFLISTGVQTTWKSINTAPVFELVFNINVFGFRIGRSRL